MTFTKELFITTELFLVEYKHKYTDIFMHINLPVQEHNVNSGGFAALVF